MPRTCYAYTSSSALASLRDSPSPNDAPPAKRPRPTPHGGRLLGGKFLLPTSFGGERGSKESSTAPTSNRSTPGPMETSRVGTANISQVLAAHGSIQPYYQRVPQVPVTDGQELTIRCLAGSPVGSWWYIKQAWSGRKRQHCGTVRRCLRCAFSQHGWVSLCHSHKKPTGLSSGRRATDMLMELKKNHESLVAKLETLEDTVKRLTRDNSRLSTNVTGLQHENEELHELYKGLCEGFTSCDERLQFLEMHSEPEAKESDSGSFTKEDAPAVDEAKLVRNAKKHELKTNAFFSCIRAVLLSLLGIRKKENLLVPLRRGFWTTEDAMDPGRLLRPCWDEGWVMNREGWVRQDGRRWSTALLQEFLDVLPENVVEEGLETCFSNLAKRYKQEQAVDAKVRENARTQNRRKRRKVVKAHECANARGRVEALSHLEFDWLFQWQYQSTDESDQDGDKDTALDPETDTEDAAGIAKIWKGSSKLQPWVQRAPAYRRNEITLLLDELDTHVMELRQAEVAETLQGNTHHARIRGPICPAKDSKLPILRKRAKKMAGREGGLSLTIASPRRLHAQCLTMIDWVAGETEVVDEGAGAGRADGEDEE
ncbi:hypothetical protein NUW54_g790 [Trametes sanguinea]|uniref:Uncharacterized protein n=1 Tax=Trametes sanguinea TaxID=158606 RepID=A0ACC1Q868_9APHY|nr:hypothetical protein NUW54_g790 [Trametes sanguinea]